MNLLESMCHSRNGLSGCLQILLLILSFSIASSAIAGERPQRILLLQGLTATQRAAQQTDRAFRARLKEVSSEDIEVFTDFLDLGRFSGPDYEQSLVPFLKGKIAQIKPDLIIPISRGATSFTVRHRAEIARDIPIIYCCTPMSTADALDIPAEIPGLIVEYDWAGTLALAERLQPNAKSLVVISGASKFDRVWLEDEKRALKPILKKYDVKYLTGQRYDVLNEVSHLPRDSIVLLMPIFDGGLGQSRVATDDAIEVAKASSAPVYSPVSRLFGGGIVGGNMDSYEQQGSKVADFALEILAGKGPSALPRQTKLPLQYRVDARQLERWGFSEPSLPPGTSVEFRQPGLWKQYKTPIIITLLGMVALVSIIALLLMQIHKRRNAEAALKESEDRMAFAASSTNVGLWRVDVATGHLWATDHCRAMFGIAPDAPLTWDVFRAAVHPDDSHAFSEWLQSATRAGLPDGQFRVTLPGQDVRWFVCRGRTVSGEHGTPLQVSGIFADITAYKSAETDAASQREEIAHLLRVASLGELSGGIAHELSQPLAAILANAQAAQSMLAHATPDAETVVQILDDIVEEDRRAGQVIHRLRHLLKKGERPSGSTNFNDLVRSTLTLLRADLIHRKIRVDLDLSPELPLISGDSVQLQQVLLNLMTNAMEAMDSTAAPLRRLSVSTRVNQRGYAEVQVSDRGSGITPEDQRRLFQPFFTTKKRGLGLGLSICSTIVTSHGGRLSVSNASQGGATAVISLPLAAPIPLAAAS